MDYLAHPHLYYKMIANFLGIFKIKSIVVYYHGIFMDISHIKMAQWCWILFFFLILED